jgi:type IV pilus assembly protein PilN
MIVPNLASRPFLNTRPVWLVTAVSILVALLFVVLNVFSYVTANRTLATQLSEYGRLEARRDALRREVKAEVATLDKVPWTSLANRVKATNLVLQEGSFSWPALLDDVERVMPYEVRLTRIAPTLGPEGVSLSLAVVCRSREAMLEFLENLIKDPSFANPIPVREELPEGSRTAAYDLTLKVDYRPPEVKP